MTSPRSIIEYANRQIEFVKGVHAGLVDGSKAIFRNYSYQNANGDAMSLLPADDIANANTAAVSTLAYQLHKLDSIVKVAEKEQRKGRYTLGGSVGGSVIRKMIGEPLSADASIAHASR